MSNDSGIRTLDVTAFELAQGTLSEGRLASARQHLLRDGAVVLNDVVDVAHIDVLRERMCVDIDLVTREYEPRRKSAVEGHLQHQPPVDPTFLFRDILANPVAMALSRAVMGPAVQVVLYTANTNMPGSKDQRPHPDMDQLWPCLDSAPPPHLLIVNIPLVATSVADAIELWLGTHLDTRTHRAGVVFDHATAEVKAWLDARRAAWPPVQALQQKGSVLVRDARLWHRGVANTLDRARVMLAVGIAPWWCTAEPITFPTAAAASIEAMGTPIVARYTDEPFDWLDPCYSGDAGPQLRRKGLRA